MKLEELKKSGYAGLDESIYVSLFQYGFIILEVSQENGEYHIIYGTKTKDGATYYIFSKSFITEIGINRITKEQTNYSQIEFYELMNMSEDYWMKQDIKQKIHDLFIFYGPTIMFGEPKIEFAVIHEHHEK